MKDSTNEDNNYAIFNTDNYKKTLDQSVYFIFDNYINLIIPYLKFVMEILKIKNKKYFKFIIIRGIDTITNVFNHLLYYTKNVELTYYHCQKSYYYYIEFIEQITDEKNVFLQLTSRDSISYVYKKTIYEINGDVRKNFEINKETNEKLKLLTLHINFANKIVNKMINDDDFLNVAKMNNERVNKLDKMLNKINGLQFNLLNIKLFDTSVEILDYKITNIDLFFETICLLLKKMNKHPLLINKLKEKILFIIDKEQDNFSIEKMINLLNEN